MSRKIPKILPTNGKRGTGKKQKNWCCRNGKKTGRNRKHTGKRREKYGKKTGKRREETGKRQKKSLRNQYFRKESLPTLPNLANLVNFASTSSGKREEDGKKYGFFRKTGKFKNFFLQTGRNEKSSSGGGPD